MTNQSFSDTSINGSGNEVLLTIDKFLCDGDLNSGFVRSRSGGLLYIIEG